MGALISASTPALLPACSLLMPMMLSHIALPCSAVLVRTRLVDALSTPRVGTVAGLREEARW